MTSAPTLLEIFIKVRTLNDELVKKKDGNIRIKLKGEQFATYERLIRVFSSLRYLNNADVREAADQDFVYFILQLVIAQYDLSSL